ncbi:MAG TPA: cephalosporin hydroxylase [Candidatus Rokubacteria bacterium]|nr:cephalosporin hydroxylase [Candidatus Rokubacteria bacterium]
MIDTAVVTRTLTPEEVTRRIDDAQLQPASVAFHRLWYETPTTWSMQRYRGLPEMKCAFDCQMYHELIMTVRPSLILETGTAWGGSALRFADMLAMAGMSGGRVITVDLQRREPTFSHHPNITRILGSSVAPPVLQEMRTAVEQARGPVLVSLDSDHSAEHVSAELDAYAPLVTVGSYLVVEDTNIAGRPVAGSERDGGPGAAVDRFVATHPAFVRDRLCERQILTMHPGGWLRRIA